MAAYCVSRRPSGCDHGARTRLPLFRPIAGRPRRRRRRAHHGARRSLAAVREAMLARDGLPAQTRQALVAKLSDTLAGFVAARAWLPNDRARRVAKEACEKATVSLAAASPESEIPPFIRHLRDSGQLT